MMTSTNVDGGGGGGASSITGNGNEHASPLKLASAKRQRLSLNFEKCIICQLSPKNEKLSHATEKGLQNVIAASTIRQDGLGKNISPPEGQVQYHKSCYASYTSQRNLTSTQSKLRATNPLSSSSTEHLEGSVRPTRSQCVSTDWSVCIICRRKTHGKERMLHKIQTMPGENALKEAARKRGDTEMLRMIASEDLIACEALYHNACLASYKNERNIKSHTAKTEDDDPFSQAFKQLIADIETDLMQNRKVFTLSFLLHMFKKLLPVGLERELYRAQALQDRLLSHYGDRIVIHSRRGQSQSSYVFSSSVSIVDALHAAGHLKQCLKDYQIEDELEAAGSDHHETDLSIIHKAVGILRREMENLSVDEKCYPSAEGVSLQAAEQFVPLLLAKAVLWLIDKDAFLNSELSDSYKPSADSKRKSLSLAECLIFNSTKTPTPLHVGLAVQLHHEYGKRGLIDTLFAHGFCLSYDDLRRFMTAIAKDQLDKIEAGTYIPPNMMPIYNGGQLVQEGADNIDINTETIDGKNTFHTMGRVVFQLQGPADHTPDTGRVMPSKDKSLPLDNDVCKVLSKCAPYRKPLQRPEPPRTDNAMMVLNSCEQNISIEQNLAWVLMRIIPRELLVLPATFSSQLAQKVPFWTGYNVLLAEKMDNKTCVAYKPVIEAPPTDLPTVYTTMKQCQEMAAALGQRHAVQTMDQQLYAIAQQIKWNTPVEFEHHILRLGGFHNLSTFIAAVGKIWGDGGLRDMLVDSGLYAANSADQMLLGKQFHRSVRGLTLTYEALMCMLLAQFQHWCQENGNFFPQIVWDQLEDAYLSLQSDNHRLRVNSVKELQRVLSQYLIPKLEEFKQQECQTSPTFAYWIAFLDAVEILLQNIQAERTGDWMMHLHSVYCMLPYFFVTNRVNYARWTPIYLLDSLHLPPDIGRKFKDGQFAVKETSRSFNGIWSDMATEKTIIRDAKSDGGIVGLTRKQPALVRWALTRHILGDYSMKMRERCGLHARTDETHEQNQPAAMKRDEKHIVDLVEHIQSNMTNPFDTAMHPESALVNISTGLHASDEVKSSLANVVNTGKQRLEAFAHGTLSSEGTRSFYAPIQRSGLKTFSDMLKPTRILHQGKSQNVCIAAELVFRRALTLSGVRESINMRSILSLPVTSVPTALFHEDGTMRKCQKSDLMKHLETKACSMPNLPAYDKSKTYVIRDAMAELHKMKGSAHRTFESLGATYLNNLCKAFDVAETVVDVWDRYGEENSVKSQERERRGDKRGTRRYQVIGGRSVPPWQKFLSLSSNKSALANYLGEYLASEGPHHAKLADPHRKILVSGAYSDGHITKSITWNGAEINPHLAVSHEEADTRMLFQAVQANKTLEENGHQGRIVIRSPDTDVLVLALHFCPQLNAVEEVWLETGQTTTATDRHRFIPVHEICKAFPPLFSTILPAVHAITGCDSVSSFFKIGKKSVLKVIEDKGTDAFRSLALFGQDDEHDLQSARELVATLYDPKRKHATSHTNLNKLRVELTSTKDVALAQLPPCEASFEQHVKRASWQTQVWLASDVGLPEPTPAEGNGWQRDTDGWLVPTFFEGPTATQMLEELLCTCSGRKRCNRSCGCQTSGLACCQACPCGGNDMCENPLSHDIDLSDE